MLLRVKGKENPTDKKEGQIHVAIMHRLICKKAQYQKYLKLYMKLFAIPGIAMHTFLTAVKTNYGISLFLWPWVISQLI